MSRTEGKAARGAGSQPAGLGKSRVIPNDRQLLLDRHVYPQLVS